MGDSPGSDQATAETTATENLAQVEIFPSDSSEISRGRIKGHIKAESAEVADMVGYSFKIKANGSYDLRTLIAAEAGQGFHGLS